MHNNVYNAHVLAGAFYYILGNVDPRFRSKIHSIQLLILAKYSSVAEFGIDQILEPAVKDIEKLESVGTYDNVQMILQLSYMHFF